MRGTRRRVVCTDSGRRGSSTFFSRSSRCRLQARVVFSREQESNSAATRIVQLGSLGCGGSGGRAEPSPCPPAAPALGAAPPPRLPSHCPPVPLCCSSLPALAVLPPKRAQQRWLVLPERAKQRLLVETGRGAGMIIGGEAHNAGGGARNSLPARAAAGRVAAPTWEVPHVFGGRGCSSGVGQTSLRGMLVSRCRCARCAPPAAAIVFGFPPLSAGPRNVAHRGGQSVTARVAAPHREQGAQRPPPTANPPAPATATAVAGLCPRSTWGAGQRLHRGSHSPLDLHMGWGQHAQGLQDSLVDPGRCHWLVVCQLVRLAPSRWRGTGVGMP